ncbi:hypothetical protein IL306_002224, partial [Fusarium sp. DS 682]
MIKELGNEALGRVVIVKNIGPELVETIGAALDIDPLFFAGHITTDFEDIEADPPPPALALLPSVLAVRGYLHLHYQQVLNLGNTSNFATSSYAFRTSAKAQRNVRRLPGLSGRQLGLARAGCSLMVKKLGHKWICLVLGDPAVTGVVEKVNGGNPRTFPTSPLHGGYEDFGDPVLFSHFNQTQSPQQPAEWDKGCMLQSLMRHLKNPPPGFDRRDPSIVSLGFYPIRIVLAEWTTYTLLMSRLIKSYEYSIQDIEKRLRGGDIVDLQRWRRRSKQSQHKVNVMAEFVNYHLAPASAGVERPQVPQEWAMLLAEIKHVLAQLAHFSQLLEQIIPLATSMFQLLDSRRSIAEAVNVRRLTYIALVFVPLSWVSALFSMGGDFLPGRESFWVYFATALPIVLIVLAMSVLR